MTTENLQQQKFTIDALLSGLGSGLSTYSGASMVADMGLGLGGMTPQQQQAYNTQKEADAKRVRMNWIIGGTVAALLIGGIIIYVVTKPKEEKAS